MANELSLSITLAFQKTGYKRVTEALSKQVTVSGGYTASNSQLIGTSDETLTFPGDMGTVGYVLFENLDVTNFILIGNDGSAYPIKLLPGEIALMRFSGTVHAKADSSACKLAFTIIEA